ncbi:hypothetical protein [Halobacteriovorax sp. HLS]|uniref:hypothetical protein n=1 Tax=Halobacteriovorax sp. HLS TaxID=2234000 RepID=UPI000FDA9573|nr:hypothetical protein [Halobacteriovorax sp. HLS]
MNYLIIMLVALMPFSSFAKSNKGNTAKKIVHLFDNATVGAVQTVLGASHIVWYMIFDDGPEFQVHNDEETEVIQMGIENSPPFFSGAYSLGLFQVGGYAHKHEGGHSVASATLGPLYLPTVGLSYLAEGHGGSFIEDWADLEAYAGGNYNVMNDFTVSPGKISVNGKDYNVVAFKYSLNEEQNAKGYGLESQKIYRWFNTNVIVPLANKNSDIESVPVVEFDLLKKEFNLIIDNVAIYLAGDQDLRWQIKTSQEYLSYDQNKFHDIVRMKAASWQASYGLIYNINDQIQMDFNVGVGAAVESLKFDSIDQERRGMSLGAKFDFNISFEENYKMTYEYEKWTLGSNTTITEEFFGATYQRNQPFKFLHKNSQLKLKLGKKEIEYETNGYQFEEDRIDFGLELTF